MKSNIILAYGMQILKILPKIKLLLIKATIEHDNT